MYKNFFHPLHPNSSIPFPTSFVLGNCAMADGSVFLKDSSVLIDLRENSISEKKLEKDMSTTLSGIHEQIKVPKTFSVSWKHYLMHAREKLVESWSCWQIVFPTPLQEATFNV